MSSQLGSQCPASWKPNVQPVGSPMSSQQGPIASQLGAQCPASRAQCPASRGNGQPAGAQCPASWEPNVQQSGSPMSSQLGAQCPAGGAQCSASWEPNVQPAEPNVQQGSLRGVGPKVLWLVQTDYECVDKERIHTASPC